MLKWHEDAYVGKSIAEEYENIKGDIENGNARPGIYIVSLSDNPVEQLDITPAFIYLMNIEYHKEPVIVGIAGGKAEAEAMVAQMAADIYSETNKVDFRSYFAV